MVFGDTRTFTSLTAAPLPLVVTRTDGGVLALASERCLAVLEGVDGALDSAEELTEDTTVDVLLEASRAGADVVVDEAPISRGARSSCRPSKTAVQQRETHGEWHDSRDANRRTHLG